jgi:hypothetical protein
MRQSPPDPENRPKVPEPESDEWITIVSGMPRSGTSLMMQMLNAGGLPALTDGKREQDTDNPRGYFEYEKVRQLGKDNSWLEEAKGKCIKIVAPLLGHLKPGLFYRVIFMQRDFEEMLASQKTMLEHSGKDGATLEPQKLKRVYERQIQEALRTLQNRQVPVLMVPYRGCIEKADELSERLNQLMGNRLDPKAMAAVVNPDLYRHRAPDTIQEN